MALTTTTDQTAPSTHYALAAQAANLNLPDGGFFRGRPVGAKTVQQAQQLSGGYWVIWTDGSQDVIWYGDCV
ncbi:hypothetical protein [Streptomyces canus]|uniref:hypothetical protein n=1 Tax=Streptomyces canus TaxID=58343 RepID=UPI002E259610